MFSFKRIVEYTADEHNGFNAVVRREPVDAKIVKKVYEPEYAKHQHLAPVVGPVPVPAPIKYYAHQQAPDAFIAPAPVQKVYAPGVLHHQKVKSPQQFFAAPQQYYAQPQQYYAQPQQYYAPPENPKYFKHIEKIPKYFKPAHEYEPQHTAVKYVSPSPSHYNHY